MGRDEGFTFHGAGHPLFSRDAYTYKRAEAQWHVKYCGSPYLHVLLFSLSLFADSGFALVIYPCFLFLFFGVSISPHLSSPLMCASEFRVGKSACAWSAASGVSNSYDTPMCPMIGCM